MPEPEIKSILIRLDLTRHTAFKTACGQDSMQRVVEKFINAYIDGHEQRAILHLNGEICPISQTILAIAAAVELELRTRSAQRVLPLPTTPNQL